MRIRRQCCSRDAWSSNQWTARQSPASHSSDVLSTPGDQYWDAREVGQVVVWWGRRWWYGSIIDVCPCVWELTRSMKGWVVGNRVHQPNGTGHWGCCV